MALLSGDRVTILPGDILTYRDRNFVAHLPGDLHRDFVAGLPGDLVALLVRMGLGSIARSIGMALAKDTSLARSISVSFASIAIATVTVSRLRGGLSLPLVVSAIATLADSLVGGGTLLLVGGVIGGVTFLLVGGGTLLLIDSVAVLLRDSV